MTGDDKPKPSGTAELFAELLGIIATLRGPNGCPWDREQTHLTLKRFLVEEAYEACEAIDRQETHEMAEELGDVLLQVVFHSQLGSEAGTFDIRDVLEILIHKLKSRHPHVFGEVELHTADQVLEQWEQIKSREKQGRKSILAGLPKDLPALLKAMRVQERARRVGFDWDKVEEVLAKVHEELGEWQQALTVGDRLEMERELGDVLFAVVNLARFVGMDPETCLHHTVEKFSRRFQYIEDELAKSGRKPEDVGLKIMDELWEAAKQLETREEGKS